MIATRSWRAVAEYCHDQIMASSAERTSYLLAHWCLRLHALLRLSLFDHLATELAALFALLPPSSYRAPLQSAPPPPGEPLFHPAVPFEMFVLSAALPGLRGDPDASIEELTVVLKACKRTMWAHDASSSLRCMWKARAEKVAAVLAAMLAQVKVSDGDEGNTFDGILTCTVTAGFNKSSLLARPATFSTAVSRGAASLTTPPCVNREHTTFRRDH